MRRAAAVRARQRKLREESSNQEVAEVTAVEDNTPKAGLNTKGGRSRKGAISKQKETDTESESLSVEHKEGQSAEDEAEEEQYEVEKIVDMKIVGGIRKYRIRWKGYNSDSDTWEIADHLNCPEAVKEYLKHNSKDNGEVSVASGRKRASKGDAISEEATTNDTQKNKNAISSEDEEEMPLAKKRKSTKTIKLTKKGTDAAEDEDDTEDDAEKAVEPPAKKRKSSKTVKLAKKGADAAEDEDDTEDDEEKAVEEPTVKEEKVKSVRSKSKGKKEETVSGEETENGVNTDETSYEVEKIMEVHHKRNGKKEYLIHWRGYPHSQDTWEPEEHLDCEDLIQEFEERVNKAKNLSVRELRTDRAHTNRYAEEQSSKRQSKRGKGKKRTTYYDTE